MPVLSIYGMLYKTVFSPDICFIGMDLVQKSWFCKAFLWYQVRFNGLPEDMLQS